MHRQTYLTDTAECLTFRHLSIRATYWQNHYTTPGVTSSTVRAPHPPITLLRIYWFIAGLCHYWLVCRHDSGCIFWFFCFYFETACRLKEPMTFLPSSGKCFILGPVDEAVSNEFGLGELARITVANEADNLTFEVRRKFPTAPTGHNSAPLQHVTANPSFLRTTKMLSGKPGTQSLPWGATLTQSVTWPSIQ